MSNQHSKCYDCYSSHLPEVHDRTILPSEAFGEGYVPELNQASEDEQIDDVLTNAIDYYISGNGVQPEAINRIKSLIRTEKLKLLAEVKGRRSTTFLAPTHGVSIADLEELEAEL